MRQKERNCDFSFLPPLPVWPHIRGYKCGHNGRARRNSKPDRSSKQMARHGNTLPSVSSKRSDVVQPDTSVVTSHDHLRGCPPVREEHSPTENLGMNNLDSQLLATEDLLR